MILSCEHWDSLWMKMYFISMFFYKKVNKTKMKTRNPARGITVFIFWIFIRLRETWLACTLIMYDTTVDLLSVVKQIKKKKIRTTIHTGTCTIIIIIVSRIRVIVSTFPFLLVSNHSNLVHRWASMGLIDSTVVARCLGID